jgi:hypothetical protein
MSRTADWYYDVTVGMEPPDNSPRFIWSDQPRLVLVTGPRAAVEEFTFEESAAITRWFEPRIMDTDGIDNTPHLAWALYDLANAAEEGALREQAARVPGLHVERAPDDLYVAVDDYVGTTHRVRVRDGRIVEDYSSDAKYEHRYD